MNQSVTHVVILAAGQGTRMKSQLPKVLHPVAGRPMLEHVLDAAAAVAPATVTVIVGHGGAKVRERLTGRPGVTFALQEPQLGTGARLAAGRTGPGGEDGHGYPALRRRAAPQGRTLEKLLQTHLAATAAATVVTASVERPYGYGRIVRVDGQIARIVEERDASPAERQTSRDQLGHLRLRPPALFDALRGIASQNSQGEFYLTDLVGIYRRRKLPVETLLVDDPEEIRGINSRTELAEVGTLVRQKKNEELMAAGVTLVDPATTYIDPRAEIGGDTVIHPGVVIEGPTRIGRACEIQAHVRIADAEIGDHVKINSFCVIVESRIASGAAIGTVCPPAARLGGGGGREDRQLRRAEEDLAWRGLEGQSPRVPRRRHVGDHVNVGAGHHHLQLRWREEAPDDHRGWRVHRQRFTARRPGDGGEGRLRRRRLIDHAGRSRWRARHRTRPAEQHRRLGGAKKTVTQKG
jgi:bifunctional UDP-N-acetylglucosamine pyrophosphorylase/glucosamine-1-phosphate N-acetyltransferase